MRTLQHVHKAGSRVGFSILSDSGPLPPPTTLFFWTEGPNTSQIAEKVKLFYFEYARNRHKMTTITPSYHAVRQLFPFTLQILIFLTAV